MKQARTYDQKHGIENPQPIRQGIPANGNQFADDASEADNLEDVKPKKHTKKAKMKSTKGDDPIFTLMKPKQLCIFIGSSEQGKTHLMKYLLLNMCLRNQFDFGIVFTTTKFNHSYDFIKNQNLVIAGYDEKILKQYLKKLRSSDEPPPNFVIFDDCIGSLDTMSEFIQNFASTFRHFNSSVFISLQYAYKVPPLFREQCNRCFMFKQNTKRSYEAIYDAYGLGFTDYKEFKATIDDITKEQFHCMYYLKEETEPNKKYGEYKAPAEIPDVRLEF